MDIFDILLSLSASIENIEWSTDLKNWQPFLTYTGLEPNAFFRVAN